MCLHFVTENKHLVSEQDSRTPRGEKSVNSNSDWNRKKETKLKEVTTPRFIKWGLLGRLIHLLNRRQDAPKNLRTRYFLTQSKKEAGGSNGRG